MGICRMFVLLAILLIDASDCEFTATPGTISGCNNSDVTLSWNITNYASVSTVQWKKQGTTIMSQSGSGTPTFSAGVTNAEHGGDGAIVIKGVQLADTGEYSCHITYTPGSSNMASSSTATLSLIVPPSYPPILKPIEEEGSTNYTCSVKNKGIPEVNVTLKVGDDELQTNTASVSCGIHKDISCCITGEAFGCLSETERCVNLAVLPSYPPILKYVVVEGIIKYTCSVTTKGIPEVNVTVKVGDNEQPTNTTSVSCGNHEDISCCITGEALRCLSGKKRCRTLGVSPSYPPILTTAVAEGSINYTCSVTNKGIPEVNVTLKVGDDELPSNTASVSCGNHNDISCCISGGVFGCLSETERCVKLGVPPSYPPILTPDPAEGSINYTCSVTTKGTPEVNVTLKVGDDELQTNTASVSCGNHGNISCCITGGAFDCLSGKKRCKTLGGIGARKNPKVCSWIEKEKAMKGCGVPECRKRTEFYIVCAVVILVILAVAIVIGVRICKPKPKREMADNSAGYQPFSKITQNPGRNEPSSETSSPITENQDRNDPSMVANTTSGVDASSSHVSIYDARF